MVKNPWSHGVNYFETFFKESDFIFNRSEATHFRKPLTLTRRSSPMPNLVNLNENELTKGRLLEGIDLYRLT